MVLRIAVTGCTRSLAPDLAHAGQFPPQTLVSTTPADTIQDLPYHFPEESPQVPLHRGDHPPGVPQVYPGKISITRRLPCYACFFLARVENVTNGQTDKRTNAQGEKRGHHHHTYGKLFSKVGFPLLLGLLNIECDA